MNHLLQINTSMFGDDSQSSRLAERFVAHWVAGHPETAVTVRDLGREPVPHLDADTFRAFGKPAAQRSDADRRAVARSDALIEELRAADTLVIGLPMYNFGIPSPLKAWFDHIARAGVTFRYTANGPERLLRDTRAYVLAARGGRYAGTDRDTQTTYVRNFLGFIGIDQVEFVYAEGLAASDGREQALARADEQISRLAA